MDFEFERGEAAGRREERRVRISERDLKVMEFLCEMKWATRSQIYEGFFRWAESRSEEYAKKRLSFLNRQGFIESARVFVDLPAVFYSTRKGWDLASSRVNGRRLPRPLTKVDPRYLEHDLHAVDCRLAIERKKLGQGWISEKLLKSERASETSQTERYKVLQGVRVPDAIFTGPSGDRVAFEFENTQKSRARYETRISEFLEMMSRSERWFERVLFVSRSPEIKKAIELSLPKGGDSFLVLEKKELTT